MSTEEEWEARPSTQGRTWYHQELCGSPINLLHLSIMDGSGGNPESTLGPLTLALYPIHRGVGCHSITNVVLVTALYHFFMWPCFPQKGYKYANSLCEHLEKVLSVPLPWAPCSIRGSSCHCVPHGSKREFWQSRPGQRKKQAVWRVPMDEQLLSWTKSRKEGHKDHLTNHTF